jgi:hypothetical protein
MNTKKMKATLINYLLLSGLCLGVIIGVLAMTSSDSLNQPVKAASALAWRIGGFSQCALADGNFDRVAFKMLFLSAPPPPTTLCRNGEKTWLIPA